MRAQTALLYCAHRYLILTCLLASLCSIPIGCLDVSTCIYITMNKHSMTHKLVERGKVGEQQDKPSPLLCYASVTTSSIVGEPCLGTGIMACPHPVALWPFPHTCCTWFMPSTIIFYIITV